ncbi:hypothetical protein RFI_06876 [Reticulomyxa filosa]|uniref:Kelch motif family protein n=1 Tax=Reticulomyxa filosa TaxID=46433 RepID=X6NVB0_RETFI|nr:hypothetical protein RFI_06876 [Reticulomyxa filosa]|eukprot:ETO30245.1 hypothetical protein RFI_06876 [Reticulomyxa filosa]
MFCTFVNEINLLTKVVISLFSLQKTKKDINSTLNLFLCIKNLCSNNLLSRNVFSKGLYPPLFKKVKNYLKKFGNINELPTPLSSFQCVLHKHEILICGGYKQTVCYSYHTLKNKYKFICEYPSDVQLCGNCVVKFVDNNNQTTLLSFGGRYKHTLVMKYVSVWSKISNISRKSNEFNNYNKWIPFTDNNNNPIIIGRNNDNYYEVRAVIGGSNNNLLFITYYPKDISVFNLNTFQFIKHYSLPIINYIEYPCFVLKSKNGQEQEVMKTNKLNYMLLFCYNTGLSIEYDEDKNTFQFHQLYVCNDITLLNKCAYVRINDIILFFGGCGLSNNKFVVSKSVRKYSIAENKWTIFENILHSPLYNCVAILSEESNYIHIIGGTNDKKITMLAHMKTKAYVWDPSLLEIKFIIQYWIQTSKIKLGWIEDFDKIIMQYYNEIKFNIRYNQFFDEEICPLQI